MPIHSVCGSLPVQLGTLRAAAERWPCFLHRISPETGKEKPLVAWEAMQGQHLRAKLSQGPCWSHGLIRKLWGWSHMSLDSGF